MPADCIEKEAEIPAPVARVWRALTGHNEFGAWFGVSLTGPFKAGEESQGPIASPGMEHLTWRAVIQQIDPEQYFAFTWHPYAIDPKADYSKEVPTLVEFHLQPTASGGTLLDIAECGFSDLPVARSQDAFDAHDKGWAQQLKNIAGYVAKNP